MILISNIKKNNKAIIFLTILALVLSWLKPLWSNNAINLVNLDTSPIFKALAEDFWQGKCILSCKITAIVLIFVQAQLINTIVNWHKLFRERTLLPGMIFIILVANLYNYQYMNEILIANIFFTISWWIIAGIYNHSRDHKPIFNSAFLLALASVFYPTYSYFIIFLCIAVALHTENRFKDILILILSFIIVWYMYFSVHYIIYNSVDLQNILNSFRGIKFTIGTVNYTVLMAGIYITVLFAISLIHIIFSLRGTKVFVRLNIKLLLIWLILGIVLLVTNLSSIEILYSIAIPTSILLSIYFLDVKNAIVREILWILLISFTIFNQLYGVVN